MLGFYAGIFLLSLACVFAWSKLNKKIVGIDINKLSQPKIPESTGIVLLIPLWAAIAYFELQNFSIDFLAFGLMASAFALIGFLDDTKHKWHTKAMPWLSRAAMIAIVCLIFAWIFAPSLLWVIPLALFIAGLASFQNTFAGLNGWQGGSGLIISLAVSFLLLGTAFFELSMALAAIILGFLMLNRYPCRVLEGDSGTLLIGSSIAGLLVMNGKIELLAFSLLFYLPHAVDFGLKMLTNPKDPSQQKFRPYKVLKDERLAIPDYPDRKERLDFPKLLIKAFGPLREWQIVLIIWVIVAVNCALWLKAFGFA